MKLCMGLIGRNMCNIQEKTWGNRFVAKTALEVVVEDNLSQNAEVMGNIFRNKMEVVHQDYFYFIQSLLTF